MAKKMISMGASIEALADKMRESGGNFSGRLNQIVERYNIMLDLEIIPDLAPEEMAILRSALRGTVDRRKVRGLHIDVIDVEAGTQQERETLAAKIESMGTGQRLKLIETLGQ